MQTHLKYFSVKMVELKFYLGHVRPYIKVQIGWIKTAKKIKQHKYSRTVRLKTDYRTYKTNKERSRMRFLQHVIPSSTIACIWHWGIDLKKWGVEIIQISNLPSVFVLFPNQRILDLLQFTFLVKFEKPVALMLTYWTLVTYYNKEESCYIVKYL